jgi:hypothetical protein
VVKAKDSAFRIAWIGSFSNVRGDNIEDESLLYAVALDNMESRTDDGTEVVAVDMVGGR